MRELFLKKTHIDPDYFLGMILNFLGHAEGVYNDLVDQHLESCTLCIDEKGKRIGLIRIKENFMAIEKLNQTLS